ncbi:MAG TPA: hypothetical protein VK548_24150, partial [Candidatus Acidoferrum sp.]|nr:hypothetical protein [Candidatus Acidoferrum sp.]
RNTETTRNRAKLFVLQALQAEPRVERVLSARVVQADRSQIDIHVTLLAIEGVTPLNLVVPFSLAGGPGP